MARPFVWRDASRTPSFMDGAIDARVVLPLPFLLLSPTVTRLVLVLVGIIIFLVLNKFKYTPSVVWRKAMSKLRGNQILTEPLWCKLRYSEAERR